jgi:hypothetical protein
MTDYERGRAEERADTVALLRRKAREDRDEDFAVTTSVWADVIEGGVQEGEAESERLADEAALAALVVAPDPNQGVIPGLETP